MDEPSTFVVARDDLRRSRFVATPMTELEEGGVLCRVDNFAFTSNNITYAELGKRFGYWQFFPAPEGWGNIPVWGFAEVIDFRHEGFNRGERIYGLLPMATHLVLCPHRVNEFRFVDATPHRQSLPPAYNLYLRVDRDPTYQPRYEGLQALLRPVFITSFLIDDFLADEGFFGADCVLLSSASSKTAFGLAHQLHRRAGIEVIGLTSTANGEFVRGLGCYDQVLAYDDIARLPSQRPTVYVDFAGSSALRGAVHEHYGSSLKYSSAIGFSHRETSAPQAGLPGPEPVFFFRTRSFAKTRERLGSRRHRHAFRR